MIIRKNITNVQSAIKNGIYTDRCKPFNLMNHENTGHI